MNTNQPTKVCPHCSANLSSQEAAGVAECPHCHAALSSAATTKSTSNDWLRFWALFLLPPILCLLFGLAKLSAASTILVAAGPVCGVVSGILLAKIIGKPWTGFILVPVLMLVELFLCMFGCVSSNFH